jgi:hypothetical protein
MGAAIREWDAPRRAHYGLGNGLTGGFRRVRQPFSGAQGQSPASGRWFGRWFWRFRHKAAAGDTAWSGKWLHLLPPRHRQAVADSGAKLAALYKFGFLEPRKIMPKLNIAEAIDQREVVREIEPKKEPGRGAFRARQRSSLS